MQVILYAVFFAAFACLIVMVKSRRKLVAVTLTAVMVMTLVGAPQPAQAQAGILSGIQAILNVINGIIQTALTSMTAPLELTNSHTWSASISRSKSAAAYPRRFFHDQSEVL